MKSKILIACLLFSFSSFNQDISERLKAYYNFTGNLSDSSGNENNIVLGTGLFSQDRFGNEASALTLNGITDSLVLPIPEFAPILGDFTISFWLKTKNPEVMNLFSSKENPTDTTTNFEIQLASNNQNALNDLPQSFYQTFVYWNGIGDLANGIAEGNPGLYSKNNWCHFLIKRTNDTLKIYYDHIEHVLSLESFYDGSLGDVVDLIFGASPYLFEGTIDDMRFYDRSLSQSEIDQLWFENNPIQFVEPKPNQAYVQGSNLLVYWEYDTTQLSDSIRVEYKINAGDWIPAIHSNLIGEYYTYIDMAFPHGTAVEVRVSDWSDPSKSQQTGKFIVSEYDWVEVQDSLPFHAKDGAGLLNFNDKMWLLGGWDPPYHDPTNTHNEVWSSIDGANWEQLTDAPWPARHASAWVSNDESMWVIGGDPQSGCLTDAWQTNNGVDWLLKVDTIPEFEKRNNPNYAYFNDHIYIFGGEICSGETNSEVWRSVDGEDWIRLPDAPWKGRGMQINYCVDGSDQLWMLGGSNEGSRRSYNDVWKTSDGISWTLVSDSAPWAGRYWHTVAWFDDKMWLLGGMATGLEMNDVWYSADGIQWYELKSTTGNWPEGTRHAQSTTVYDHALWYMCGISTNNVWKILNTTEVSGLTTENQIDSQDHTVFPNPSSGTIQISSSLNLVNEKFKIVNLSGEVVFESKIEQMSSVFSIEHLAPGIYFLILETPNFEVLKITII